MLHFYVQMQSLVIDPLSVMVSLHTSLKVFIALDRSPLLFSAFERQRVCTTSYRLGHALTRHYLSGALFRAGKLKPMFSLQLIFHLCIIVTMLTLYFRLGSWFSWITRQSWWLCTDCRVRTPRFCMSSISGYSSRSLGLPHWCHSWLSITHETCYSRCVYYRL